MVSAIFIKNYENILFQDGSGYQTKALVFSFVIVAFSEFRLINENLFLFKSFSTPSEIFFFKRKNSDVIRWKLRRLAPQKKKKKNVQVKDKNKNLKITEVHFHKTR